MKLFKFRLERVLHYRKHMEKKALSGLINVNKEYAEKKESIEQLTVERSKVTDDLFAQELKGIEVPHLNIYTSFLQKLNSDLETGRIEVRNSERKVKTQEAVVRRETVKRKALETVKGNRIQTYLHETEQEEQKFLDELVIKKRWMQP